MVWQHVIIAGERFARPAFKRPPRPDWSVLQNALMPCHLGRRLVRILQQSIRSAQASAFYCYLCAALSAAASVVAWFMLPSPFLILFTAGCAVALILSGIWYRHASRKQAA